MSCINLMITLDSVCVEINKANEEFNIIKKSLDDGFDYIIFDFSDVDVIIAHYLHIVIGQLYNYFPEILLKQRLQVTNIKQDHKELLKDVVDLAKVKFKKLGN